jgi:hypothetical protein
LGALVVANVLADEGGEGWYLDDLLGEIPFWVNRVAVPKKNIKTLIFQFNFSIFDFNS